MSERPIIAAKQPAAAELEKGKDNHGCRCGRSKNQPFCNGSHKGSGLSPIEFTPDEDGDPVPARDEQGVPEAERLARFLGASTPLMQVMARACGHERLTDFNPDDLTTWKRKMPDLPGVRYGKISGP